MRYSAKVLARFIVADPAVRTYADIGRKAFGNRSTHFISLLFCMELFTVTVALVTLYADSLGEPTTTYPALSQLTGFQQKWSHLHILLTFIKFLV